MHTIINIQNENTTVRDLTADEIAQQQLDELNDAKLRHEINESINKRTALLAKLGITEEEAKLLLGGN